MRIFPVWMAIVGIFSAASGVLAAAPDPRADVVIYGDHRLERFANGQAFRIPFTHQNDHNAGSPDPVTRLTYEAVSGIRNTLGASQWGLASFGKYIFVGDYSHGGTLFSDGRTGDQRLGVYDSENKTFCKLDIVPDPDVDRLATQRSVAVANPSSRKSRIFFAGNDNGCYASCLSSLCSNRFCSGEAWAQCTAPSGEQCDHGAAFGWIEADLDSPSPCETWPGFLGPHYTLANDGMAVLNHTDTLGDPFGTDTVITNNYEGGELDVLRIDSGGATVVAQYDEPSFSLTFGGATCTYYGSSGNRVGQFRQVSSG